MRDYSESRDDLEDLGILAMIGWVGFAIVVLFALIQISFFTALGVAL